MFTMQTKHITGTSIQTYKREIVSACTLDAEAGTNGYHGGDAGHGSKTYIKLSISGGNLNVLITKGADKRYAHLVDSVELFFEGDAELTCIQKALAFCSDVLIQQAHDIINVE